MCHGHAIVALLQWEPMAESLDDDPGLVDDNPEREVA